MVPFLLLWYDPKKHLFLIEISTLSEYWHYLSWFATHFVFFCLLLFFLLCEFVIYECQFLTVNAWVVGSIRTSFETVFFSFTRNKTKRCLGNSQRGLPYFFSGRGTTKFSFLFHDQKNCGRTQVINKAVNTRILNITFPIYRH